MSLNLSNSPEKQPEDVAELAAKRLWLVCQTAAPAIAAALEFEHPAIFSTASGFSEPTQAQPITPDNHSEVAYLAAERARRAAEAAQAGDMDRGYQDAA